MGRTVSFFLSTCLLTWTLAATARGQTTPPAPGTPPPPSEDDASIPGVVPDVKDPMLEPVPPAAHEITTWRDVLRLVHQRSTALHIAKAGVDQASAQKRRALAAALPTLDAGAALNHHLLYGRGVIVNPGAQTTPGMNPTAQAVT